MSRPDFTPELAEDVEKLKEMNKPEDRILRWPKYISTKFDGIRLFTEAGDVLTRSRKRVKNKHVHHTLKGSHLEGLDGEVIVGEPTDDGVYHRTQSAVNSIRGEPDFQFFVFDDLRDLTLTFEERQAELVGRDLPSFCVIAPQVLVYSQSEYEGMFRTALDQGYEGLILRNPDALHKNGRATVKSQDMLKAKPFQDSEALVMAYEEAMTNNNPTFINELGRTDRSSHQANLAGAGRVGVFLGNDIETGLPVRIAPGKFTHEELIALWLAGPVAGGRIIKYRHMPYGVKEETGAVRFGRALGWRDPSDM